VSEISFEIIQLDHPVDSTYNYLITLLQQRVDLPSGTVIHSDYQTAGRGQQSNSWFSSPGLNALPSVYLRLLRPLQYVWTISEATAIAVYKTYKTLLPEDIGLMIKWPNDIFLKDHKIAGILIHNTLMRGIVAHTIIGIGMNINEDSFPQDFPQATSLYLETGEIYDVQTVLKSLLIHLGEELSRTDYDSLHREYNTLLYRRGRLTYYRDATTREIFCATIEGVNPQGRLILATSTGEVRDYAFKEVVYL